MTITEKKPDRRISRTRRMLKDALMSLILEKGYDAVTIEDITTRADLGRTTFYLHYRDKAELLLESIDTIADDLLAKAIAAGLIPGSHVIEVVHQEKRPPILLIIFQHAADNAELWRIILRGEGATMATGRLREILSGIAGHYFEESWKQVSPHRQPEIPIELIAQYFAGSILGFITCWLENDLPYSAEKMEEMFRAMFFEGIYRVLSLPQRAET